jgi:hypothetical protein
MLGNHAVTLGKHFILNFSEIALRWFLEILWKFTKTKPAFLAGIKPCDVIMHKSIVNKMAGSW